MARKAKPKAEDWVKWLDAAKRYRLEYGRSDRWATYRNYYRGQFPRWGRDSDGFNIFETLPLNITYAMAKTMIPNIYFRNPYITATPRFKPELELHAKMIESLDNLLIQQMDLKRVIKTALLDTFLCGKGIIKIGYDSEFGFEPKSILAQHGINDATATKFAGGNMPKSGRGEAIEYNVNMRPGMPWVQRVSPDSFLVPFGTRLLEEAQWVSHSVIRRLEDVQADIKYKNTKDLRASQLENTLIPRDKMKFWRELEKEMDFVELHEIRDAKYRDLVTLVSSNEGTIIRGPMRDHLQFDGLPFVDITFNEDPDYFWAMSDASIIEPQQLEMNETRKQTMQHRRLGLLKFMFQKGMIEPEEISKFFSEDAGPGIMVNGNPRDAVLPIQPHIPADQTSWVRELEGDVRRTLGVGTNQMGETKSSRTTAMEAGLVQQAHDLRSSERRDIMADALIRIMRKVNQVVFSFWDKPRVIQVVGVDGAVYWVDYTPQAIRGDYDLKIDIESLTPHTKQLKRKEIAQLIQVLGTNPNINLDFLMRQLLREFDYMDTLRILPQAQETLGGKSMNQGQFLQQQQKLLTSPKQMQQRTQDNSQRVAALPQGGA